jgi:membrane protease YdiL (CAAX protease family)
MRASACCSWAVCRRSKVFVYGLVLGWFRWVAGSTILTILLHSLINCEGMLETFIAIHA